MTDGCAQRRTECVQQGLVELPQDATIDFVETTLRCDAPHMLEGHAGENAAPEKGDADAAQSSENFVDDVQCAIEGSIGIAPDAVNRVRAIRFSQHLFELDLEQRRN